MTVASILLEAATRMLAVYALYRLGIDLIDRLHARAIRRIQADYAKCAHPPAQGER